MSFDNFMVILITVMVGVIGYFLVKKDTEEKEWRKRTEAKIDEMHQRIMGNLESYLLREPALENAVLRGGQ